jgi:hypothetical protein
MALAVTSIARMPLGNRVLALASITFDATYPAGGEEITASQLGLKGLEAVFVTGGSDGFVLTAIRTSAVSWKIKAYESGTADAALDEFDAGAGLEAVTDIRLLAIGK